MEKDPDLPSGWRKKQSKSRPGKPWYYINTETGETQWEKPSKRQKTSSDRGDSGGDGGAEEVRVLHLLKKHCNSRRPASWRNDNITITKDEATELVKTLREEISKAENVRSKFEELAKVESDCSSAKRGGDLGNFGRGQMMKAFEQVSFALKTDELSDLVETDSGVHIIYRIS